MWGVRAQPEFSETLATSFRCEVHAFDPSAVTREWFPRYTPLRDVPNYHMHYYGAGGIDGNVTLHEYGWQQVSMLRYPPFVRDCSKMRPDAKDHEACAQIHIPNKRFQLPVRTLGSIMRELGHKRIDVLKLDVEGSEYAFLEDAIDTGAIRAVQQLTMEYHHFPHDARYGYGSAPALNALATTLEATSGLRLFAVQSQERGKSDGMQWYIIIRHGKPQYGMACADGQWYDAM